MSQEWLRLSVRIGALRTGAPVHASIHASRPAIPIPHNRFERCHLKGNGVSSASGHCHCAVSWGCVLVHAACRLSDVDAQPPEQRQRDTAPSKSRHASGKRSILPPSTASRRSEQAYVKRSRRRQRSSISILRCADSAFERRRDSRPSVRGRHISRSCSTVIGRSGSAPFGQRISM